MTKLNNNLKELCDLSYYNPIGFIILNYLKKSYIDILKNTITQNNYNLTKLLLDNIDNKYLYGYYGCDILLLFNSINSNNNDIIYLLLNYIDIDTITTYENQILCELAKKGNITLIKYLILNYNLNYQGCHYSQIYEEEYDNELDYEQNNLRDNYTPLYYAVEYKHYKLTKFLLKLGANPNIWSDTTNDYEGKLPLHAAVEANNYKIAKLLILFGANPNKSFISIYNNLDDDICHEPIKHYSPLILAIENKQIKFVKLFKHYYNSITHQEYLELKKSFKESKYFIYNYTKSQYDLLEKYN